jgi:hypothetical protein
MKRRRSRLIERAEVELRTHTWWPGRPFRRGLVGCANLAGITRPATGGPRVVVACGCLAETRRPTRPGQFGTLGDARGGFVNFSLVSPARYGGNSRSRATYTGTAGTRGVVAPAWVRRRVVPLTAIRRVPCAVGHLFVGSIDMHVQMLCATCR